MTLTPTHTFSALALAAALLAAPLAASAASGPHRDGAMGSYHNGATCQHQKAFRHGGDRMAFRQGGGQGHWGSQGLRGLNLSQDQQDQVFKIRHEQAQAYYDQKKALRAAAQNLRELGQADSLDDAAARQAADALGQAQAQLALLRTQTMAQIRAVLTPEQRQQLAEQHSKRHAARSARS